MTIVAAPDTPAIQAALDPRINLFRPDLADASLRAFVEASRFVEGALHQCLRGLVPVFEAPQANAPRLSEVRYGEFIDVFERRLDGYLWIQNRSDHAAGYIPADTPMNQSISSLSHRIKSLHAFLYAEPHAHAPVLDRLTLGAFVTPIEQVGAFWSLEEGGYVFAPHVSLTEESFVSDYIFTAGRMLGVPYLRGGRSPLGLDAAGLVQLVLTQAGYDEAPRFADLQREAYGRPLSTHWRDLAWQRGDIVFFDGHVGLMTDHDHMIHASPAALQVVVEPLAAIVDAGNEIIAIGRPTH